jgi:hypothetical protein
MRTLASASLALTLLSAPASATEPAKATKEKKVCKLIEGGFTGSRIGDARRTCKTASEWRRIEDASVKRLRDTESTKPERTRVATLGND